MHPIYKTFLTGLLATTLWAASSSVLRAQFVWDGGHAAQDKWTLSQNWNPNGSIPTNDGTANVVFAGSIRLTPDSNGNWNLNSINFNSSAGAFTLGGGTLTLQGTAVTHAIENQSVNTQTINHPLILGAAQSWSATQGDLVFTGTINLATYALTLTGANDISASGVISGTGGLTKAGSGTLTLTGANTYSGGTTVSAGTLVGNATSLQGDIANSAALVFDQAGAGSYAGVISGAGTFAKQGTGTLTLTGSNSFTGTTTVSAGTLQLGTANALADTTAVTIGSGATFALNAGNETIGSFAGSGSINLGSYTLIAGGTNASTAFSGVISGTGGLTKAGTGTLTLTGANTYSGGTTVSAGTLVGNATSLQGNIANGAALVFDQATAGSYAGVISGAGTFAKQGAGTLTLTGSNTFTGNATISAGTLQLGTAYALADTTAVAIDSGATLALTAANETIGSFAGSGSINLGSYTLTAGGTNASTAFSGVISGTGGLIKTGTGTLTLTGANDYEGGTTISGGTLLGNTTSLQGNIANSAALVFDQAGDGSYGGIISGSGNITKQGVGTLTLTGANAYGGATTVAAGTLALGADNAIASSSTLTLSSGATFDLGGSFSVLVNSLTYNNAILEYGTPGTASAFLFSTFGSDTGILTVNNWESGTDVLAFKSGITSVPTFIENIYFSGIGSGTLGATGQTVGTYDGTWDFIVANAGTFFTWDGGAPDGDTENNFNTALNWSTDVAPTSGVTTKIAFAGTTRQTPDLDSDFTLNSLKFDNTAGSFTLNATAGSEFTFDGIVPSIIQASASNQLVNAPIILNTLTFVETSGAGDLTLAGAISGSGGLNKLGTGGDLILSGANTYTGTTTINEGTVVAANSSALGSTAAGTTVASGATLALQGGITIGAEALALSGNLINIAGANSYGGAISGTGAVTVSGGSLTLAGASANTYTGTTAVQDGTLALAKTGGVTAVAGTLNIGDNTGAASSAIVQLGAANQIGDTVAVTLSSDGRLDLNNFSDTIGSLASSSSAANVQLGSGTLTAGGDNTSTTFAGVIAGTGGLTKAGTGTLTLSGTSTYSGTTTISQGTVIATNSSALGSTTGGTTVASGATLALQNNVTIGAEALSLSGNLVSTAGTNTYGGAISGTGAVTLTTGSLTLSGASANTYTGATTVQDGTLALAKTAGVTAVSGALTVGDSTGAASSAVVQLGAANQIGDTVAVTLNSDGRLNLNNYSDTIGSLASSSAAANVQLGSGTLTAGGNNTSTTFAGTIAGTGGLTKAGTGTLTLTAANTYTGTTTVAAGTLALGTSNVIADTSNLTLGYGSTLQLGGTRSERVGSLAFDTAAIDFGTTGTANYFLFADDSAFAGSLNISNWTVGSDVFGVATNAVNQAFLDSLYFTGIGVGIGAELSLAQQAVGAYGNYYVITPIETFVWDGGQNSGTVADQDNWSKGNNWAGNIAPATGAAKAIVMAGSVKTTNDMDGAYILHSLLFRSDAGAFTINSSTGDTMTIRGGGIYNESASTQTIGTSIALGANQAWNAAAGDLVFSGATITNGAYNLTITGDNDTLVSSVLGGGSGSLTKAGAGTLTLSGANTYTGATTVSAGTLIATNNAALGTTASGTTVASGATLALQNNITITGEDLTLGGTLRNNSGTNTYAGTISGTGNVTVAGGALTLGGAVANTYTGATTVQDGTLALAKTGGVTAVAGALNVGDGTGSAFSAIVQLGGANQIGDTVAVTLSSDGRLDLNNFSDTIGSLASSSSAANVQLGSGTLTTGGSNASTTYAGTIAGTGGLTQTGTGNLTLAGTTANTFTGNLAVNSGTVTLEKTAGVNAVGGNVVIGDSAGAASTANLVYHADNQLADTSDITINSDGRLEMGTFSDAVATLGGTGLLDLGTTGELLVTADGTASPFSGSITGSGNLEVSSTGLLALASDISYTGSLTLAGGTLLLGDNDLSVTNLVITGSSTINFAGTASSLSATNLIFANTSVTLTILNWELATEFLFASTWAGAIRGYDAQGQIPMNQISFNGLSGDFTGWEVYSDRIRPNVPEPSTYGLILTAAGLALFGYRRWRGRKA